MLLINLSGNSIDWKINVLSFYEVIIRNILKLSNQSKVNLIK